MKGENLLGSLFEPEAWHGMAPSLFFPTESTEPGVAPHGAKQRDFSDHLQGLCSMPSAQYCPAHHSSYRFQLISEVFLLSYSIFWR